MIRLLLPDGRQHTNMLWNELSLNTRSEEKYAAWGTTYETKPTQMESGFTLNFQRGSGAEEQQVFASSNLSFSDSAYQTSAGKSNFQLPSKGFIYSFTSTVLSLFCGFLRLKLNFICFWKV